MTLIHDRTPEAVALLHAHAARHVVGELADTAQVAAVVGVERVAAATGVDDPQTLRAHLDDHDDPLVAEVLQSVVVAVERVDGAWAVDASTVNAEAGAHPVSTDATLLRAAVRAGHDSLADMPYYGLRYGARGARFTTSDSAWLVALVAATEGVALQQVTWLATLLARKGMPSWLLERHLLALEHHVRDAGRDPGPLRASADALAERRRAHLDDDALERADALAERMVIAPPTPRTGALLAAALADVRSGFARDDDVLTSWLVDPARTTRDDADAVWAVRELVALA